jgi:uncharacterized protein YqfB (UPF0267 family)
MVEKFADGLKKPSFIHENTLVKYAIEVRNAIIERDPNTVFGYSVFVNVPVKEINLHGQCLQAGLIMNEIALTIREDSAAHNMSTEELQLFRNELRHFIIRIDQLMFHTGQRVMIEVYQKEVASTERRILCPTIAPNNIFVNHLFLLQEAVLTYETLVIQVERLTTAQRNDVNEDLTKFIKILNTAYVKFDGETLIRMEQPNER